MMRGTAQASPVKEKIDGIFRPTKKVLNHVSRWINGEGAECIGRWNGAESYRRTAVDRLGDERELP